MTIPPEIQLIFSQSPALALAFFIWYFNNRELLRLIQERREILDELAKDHKEMVETLRIDEADSRTAYRQLIDDYKVELRRSTETQVAMQAEMHALKGRVHLFVLKVEAMLVKLGAMPTKGVEDE